MELLSPSQSSTNSVTRVIGNATVFEQLRRGRRHYQAFVHDRVGEDVIYGWLASYRELDVLNRMGMKHFRDLKLRTVREIEQVKQREYEMLDAELFAYKTEIEDLDTALDAGSAALEDILMQLEAQEEEKERQAEAFAKELEECGEEANQKQLFYEEQLERAEHKLREREIAQKHVKMQSNEYTKLVQRVTELRKQCGAMDAQKRDLDERMRNTISRASAIEKLRKAQESQERYRRGISEVLEKHRELHKTQKIRRVLKLAEEEGLKLEETECAICLLAFTPIMTREQQRAEGRSQAAVDEMNLQPSTDKHCWRNRVEPCGHAYMCGGCLHEQQMYTRKTRMDFKCGICNTSIESFSLARMA